jgi:hypothetical protein
MSKTRRELVTKISKFKNNDVCGGLTGIEGGDCKICPFRGALCLSRNFIENAKQWLLDNPEPKLTIDIESIAPQANEWQDVKPEPMTKREYLLKLVAKMEANKKEFNETTDKQIEKLNKEMCCDGCYIQSDGKYKMHEYKLDQSTAVKVADFINGMESTMEAK